MRVNPLGDTKFYICTVSIMSLLIVGSYTVSCLDKIADDHQTKTTVVVHTIENVIKEHTGELMSIPGVVGVGQGLCDNTPCIKIYIIRSTPELDRKIPAVLDGYRVSTEVTGSIRAHPDD
jgi:hypothetical protein